MAHVYILLVPMQAPFLRVHVCSYMAAYCGSLLMQQEFIVAAIL